jgi:hypothetical protein
MNGSLARHSVLKVIIVSDVITLCTLQWFSHLNRTIKLWNNLPTEVLVTVRYKPHMFRKRVRKLDISEAK